MSTAPAPRTAPADSTGRWPVLAALVLGALVVVQDSTAVLVALRTVRQELDATQTELVWAVVGPLLVLACLWSLCGGLSDRYGRRLVLVVGLTLFACAGVLCASAASPEMLVASRVLAGAGGAAALRAALAVVEDVTVPAERSRARGVEAGSVGAALVLGLVLGGLLAEGDGWRAVFLADALLAAVALAAVLAVVPESSDPTRRRPDLRGALLSLAGLGLVVHAIVQSAQSAGWSRPAVVGPMVGGLALLALLGRLRRGGSPDPASAVAPGALVLAGFALLGALFVLTAYLQDARQYSPLEAGLRMLPLVVGLAVCVLLSARLVRRLGRTAVCASGLLAVALAFGGYRLVDATTPVWAVTALLAVQGAALALVVAPATTATAAAGRGADRPGSAVPWLAAGGVLGVAVLGAVHSAAYRSGITPSLDDVPDELRDGAAGSLGGTLQASEQLAIALAAPLERAAVDAFVEALHTAATAAAALCVLGALAVLRWLPGRSAVAPDAPADVLPR